MGAAARRYGRSQGWFSTIENGLLPIRLDELIDLLDFYEVTDPTLRESLCHLARQGRRKNWTHQYQDRISPAALDLASLESDSATIRTFQPHLIPGLLQTEGYTRAVMKAGLPTATRDTAALVAFRMARQAVLSRPDLPGYRVVVGEAALHQQVGGTDVMRIQLMRVLEAAGQDHISVHVLPYAAGAHLWVGVPYDLFTLRPPGRLTVAVVSQVTQSLFIEDEETAGIHEAAFDHLLAAALDKHHSLEAIQQILSEL
jgi:hypothetical protein